MEKHQNPKVWVVILAGGLGKRMAQPGNEQNPKQFNSLGGKTLLEQTLKPFIELTKVHQIIISLPQSDYAQHLKRITLPATKVPIRFVEGGETRQESSYKALQSIKAQPDDLIVYHDGARPLASKDLILRTIQGAKEKGAAICTIPSNDTLIKEENGFLKKMLDRSHFLRVQTPQVFRFDWISQAHEKAKEDHFDKATDDSSLLKRIDLPIYLVEGEPNNIKITYPVDLELAELLIRQKEEKFKGET